MNTTNIVNEDKIIPRFRRLIIVGPSVNEKELLKDNGQL